MRTVVFGATGQLGRELVARLEGEVDAPGREQADFTQPEQLAAYLDVRLPEVVINCAAYNLVDRAESEPGLAFAVNAIAPGTLARWCGQRGRTLVHFSTDHVFGLDAGRRVPWIETDLPGPVSTYGVSKRAGEDLVRASCPRHLVVRTCGLYGRSGTGGKGGNFVETMLRLAREGRAIRVVDDQVCTPTPAAELAEGVLALLAADRPGLYHCTSAGQCSWFEFAGAIFELAGIQADLTPVSTADYGAVARRPAYSVLDGTAARALGVIFHPWREGLAEYLRSCGLADG